MWPVLLIGLLVSVAASASGGTSSTWGGPLSYSIGGPLGGSYLGGLGSSGDKNFGGLGSSGDKNFGGSGSGLGGDVGGRGAQGSYFGRPPGLHFIESPAQYELRGEDRFLITGMQGFGFDKRTLESSGLRKPITKESFQKFYRPVIETDRL